MSLQQSVKDYSFIFSSYIWFFNFKWIWRFGLFTWATNWLCVPFKKLKNLKPINWGLSESNPESCNRKDTGTIVLKLEFFTQLTCYYIQSPDVLISSKNRSGQQVNWKEPFLIEKFTENQYLSLWEKYYI